MVLKIIILKYLHEHYFRGWNQTRKFRCFQMKFDTISEYASILGRVVKAIDLRPIGRSPREFEPRRMQFYILPQTYVIQV